MSRSGGTPRHHGMSDIAITGSTEIIGRHAVRDKLAEGSRRHRTTRAPRRSRTARGGAVDPALWGLPFVFPCSSTSRTGRHSIQVGHLRRFQPFKEIPTRSHHTKSASLSHAYLHCAGNLACSSNHDVVTPAVGVSFSVQSARWQAMVRRFVRSTSTSRARSRGGGGPRARRQSWLDRVAGDVRWCGRGGSGIKPNRAPSERPCAGHTPQWINPASG